MAATAFLGHVAVAAPVQKGDEKKSWVGKTVMPKKYAQTAVAYPREVIRNPDGSRLGIEVILQDASHSVKADDGTRIEIFDSNNFSCWIDKDQVVVLDQAVAFFSKALKENEKDTFALTSRGWAQYLLGKPEKAIADFDQFLKLTPAGSVASPRMPARWEGLVNRGLVFAEQGEFDKALKDLEEAVRDDRSGKIARANRGYTYSLMGDYQKALVDYRATTHVLAGNNYAWLRATCPDARFRDATEALRVAKGICDATDNREGMYLDTLAAAYAEAGLFDDAVKTQEKALKDKSFMARYGDEARKRLKLYQDKKPFRTEVVKKRD